MVKLVLDKKEKKDIATSILENLPDWFGLPEYTKNYIEKSCEMPFFAFYKDGKAVGFVSLKETSHYTAEIFCMGILKDYHRLGIGKELFQKFEDYAKENGYKFIQVKTVEMGKYKEYDQTNLFYKNVGFLELEVFPTLWDESNPCQIYVKAI